MGVRLNTAQPVTVPPIVSIAHGASGSTMAVVSLGDSWFSFDDPNEAGVYAAAFAEAERRLRRAREPGGVVADG